MSDTADKKSMIAERARLAREMAGLTQGQAARMLDLHRPSITEIEAGRRKVSSDELQQLSKLYGVSTTWLIGEDNVTPDATQTRIQIAARELASLKDEDLQKLLKVIRSLRSADEGGVSKSIDAQQP